MRQGLAINRKAGSSIYSYWFLLPAFSIMLVFFMIPVLISFYFSLTVWNFTSSTFVGLDNFRLFFTEHQFTIGLKNTFIYAFMTSGLKVVLAFLIALYLTGPIRSRNILRSIVFFPNLVSAIAVGIAFKAMLHPTRGIINQAMTMLGLNRVDWLGNSGIALYAIIFTDVWRGLSIATVIYIAGITSIDTSYYEAASIDGANYWQKVRYIILPLCAPARNTVIVLSLIGGIRSFELIWTMTKGGPGFATDVLASIIYKQYAQGYYGLSTAGNVMMLLFIALLVFPLQRYLNSREAVA